MHTVNKIHIHMPYRTKKYAISFCFPDKGMSGWIIHEVCFRFDNPAARCSLSFEMHKVTSQQFFGDGKRILLIKWLRKNHDGPSRSASSWLALKGGKMVD